MSDFRKLRVWQETHELVLVSHRIATRMRGAGSVTLRDQITRAVMSVSSNIVEGAAHESPKEFARFLRYAIGSVSEVEGHAQTAFDLGMIAEPDFTALLARIIDVRKMLYGLLKKILRPGSGKAPTPNGERVQATGTGDEETVSHT